MDVVKLQKTFIKDKLLLIWIIQRVQRNSTGQRMFLREKMCNINVKDVKDFTVRHVIQRFHLNIVHQIFSQKEMKKHHNFMINSFMDIVMELLEYRAENLNNNAETVIIESHFK